MGRRRRRDSAHWKKQTRRPRQLRLAVDEEHTLRCDFIAWLQARANDIEIVACFILEPRSQCERRELELKASIFVAAFHAPRHVAHTGGKYCCFRQKRETPPSLRLLRIGHAQIRTERR